MVRRNNFIIGTIFIVVATGLSSLRLLAWKFGIAGSVSKYFLSYIYTIMSANYFHSGFVRRGLGGTLFYLFNRDRTIYNILWFQLLGAIWLSIPLAVLICRFSAKYAKQWIWFAIIAAFSPQLFVAWSRDVGRGDMLVCGFIAWALVLTCDRRYILAASTLFVGSLVHENAIIFGTPLCIAIGFLDCRNGKEKFGKGIAALSGLAAMLLLALGAEVIFGPNPTREAQTMINSNPGGNNQSDIAIYMTVSGARSLISSACSSFRRPAVILYMLSCVAILSLYAIILLSWSRKTIFVFLFASMLPMVAMLFLAIDYGRWLSMAVMSAWLAAVGLRLKGLAPANAGRGSYALAISLFASVCAMGTTTQFYANDATGWLARRIWPWSNESLGRIETCDPGWRSAIGLPRQ